MTSAELEAAATVTLRFLRNLAHDEPESRAKVQYIRGSDKIHSLDFVAGGRYLVSVSESRVALWDLGVIGYKNSDSGKGKTTDLGSSPRLVAEIQCDVTAPWVHTETNGDDILVRVTSAEGPGYVHQLESFPISRFCQLISFCRTWTVLYKTDPSQPVPRFEHFAALKTELFWSNSFHFDVDNVGISLVSACSEARSVSSGGNYFVIPYYCSYFRCPYILYVQN
ncbi:hypothetical protein DL96DRAFT_1099031 [Flagelloscypha sp. PMI_526]|nr:hypothetical protein DL96DRAFT_1099031 [Flagelloscypha sp. PMI_526]